MTNLTHSCNQPNYKFVITGTGRSASKYCAQVLTLAGYPTRHEVYYRPKGSKVSRLTVRVPEGIPVRGEASWYATRYLLAPYSLAQQTTVFHVVRHPVDCINSFLSQGYFTNNALWRAWQEQWGVHEGSILDQLVHRWIWMNRTGIDKAHKVYLAELLTSEDFVDMVRHFSYGQAPTATLLWAINKAMSLVPRNFNSRPPALVSRPTVTLEDIARCREGWRLIAMAKELGYV